MHSRRVQNQDLNGEVLLEAAAKNWIPLAQIQVISQIFLFICPRVHIHFAEKKAENPPGAPTPREILSCDPICLFLSQSLKTTGSSLLIPGSPYPRLQHCPASSARWVHSTQASSFFPSVSTYLFSPLEVKAEKI